MHMQMHTFKKKCKNDKKRNKTILAKLNAAQCLFPLSYFFFYNYWKPKLKIPCKILFCM